VNALKSLNYRCVAASDYYHGTNMLAAADAGFFIHAPEAIAAQFPQFSVCRSLDDPRAATHGAATALEPA